MMSDTPRSSTVLARIRIAAVVTAIAGAVLFLVATVLDWSGFWGGFGQGVAIALIVSAAYLAGLLTGLRRGGPAASWLPASPGSGA